MLFEADLGLAGAGADVNPRNSRVAAPAGLERELDHIDAEAMTVDSTAVRKRPRGVRIGPPRYQALPRPVKRLLQERLPQRGHLLSEWRSVAPQ